MTKFGEACPAAWAITSPRMQTLLRGVQQKVFRSSVQKKVDVGVSTWVRAFYFM